MARTTNYNVSKRRKREGKTDYRKRLSLLLSHKPRIVIRRSHNNITLQIVEYRQEGDTILVSAHSNELKTFGYVGHCGNKKAGYLVGLLGGERAIKGKVSEAVLDIGRVPPVKGSVVFAILLGILEAGLKVPHSETILPEAFSDLEDIKKNIKGA